MEIFNTRTDLLEREITHQYANIKGVRLEGRQKRYYTAINFYFYQGWRKRYVFVEKDDDSDTSEFFKKKLVEYGKQALAKDKSF
jgi:hypothetical protein